MVRMLLKPTLLITLMLVLAINVIRAVPYDESPVYAFLTAPENCDGECLMGLHMGETTVDEAMQHLETHPWVVLPRLSASGGGYGQIRWEWSGLQPDLIDSTHDGRLTFYWDQAEENAPTLGNSIIETISIYTHIRMDTLQGWFGIPYSGTAAFRPDDYLGFSAAYAHVNGTVALSTELTCPVNLMSYWNAETRITMSVGRGVSNYVTPAEMTRMC